MRWGDTPIDDGRAVMLIGVAREGMQIVSDSLSELDALLAGGPDQDTVDVFRLAWHAASSVMAVRETTAGLLRAFGDPGAGGGRLAAHLETLTPPDALDCPTVSAVIAEARDCLTGLDAVLADLSGALTVRAQARLDAHRGPLLDDDMLADQMSRWSAEASQ